MRMYDMIRKKKSGKALTGEEIRFMTEGYAKGEIPDYQMSALMMAICFQGMTREETLSLTLAMRDSGEGLRFVGSVEYQFDFLPRVAVGVIRQGVGDQIRCLPGVCPVEFQMRGDIGL